MRKVCYPLAEGRGSLRLEEDGLRITVTVRLPDDRRGLYKAWLTGGGGGELLLGTLLPEGGVLTLRRQMSVDQLKRAGVWPPEGGRVCLVFPSEGGALPEGWCRVEKLEALLEDCVLRGQAEGRRGVLYRPEPWGKTVALPFGWGGPVPLEAAFCLLCPAELEGRSYLLLALDEGGQPRRPGKWG